MNIRETVDELSHTTAAQWIRNGGVLAAAITAMLILAGTVMKPYAREVLAQAMTELGVSPKSFTDIQKKVGEIDAQTESLGREIGAVKQQSTQQIIQLYEQGRQLDQMQKDNGETKALVQKLLNLQLGISP